MPAFAGRIAAHRLVSSAAATSPLRVVIAKSLGRVSCLPQSSLPLLRAGFVRAYATPGRPKKTEAASSTAQSAGRTRKTAAAAAAPKAAKKTTTATKPKKATTAATKAKAKPKKKAAAAKPKPKRKVLTEEQKARKEKRELVKEKAELKAKALFSTPKQLPSSAWQVYVARHAVRDGTPMSKQMTKISEDFKSLSQSEQEELHRVAEANKLQNAAQYKAWVESHTPEDIAQAQAARERLRKKFGYARVGRNKIQDDRQPKRVRSAFIYFFRARYGSGDYPNVGSNEAVKQIAKEWNSLSALDRQPFIDLSMADSARYKKEVQSVLHREVRSDR